MSADGFTKLFSSIIHSSIWQEPSDVRVVWVTLLAMADAHGEVRASIPGLARAAGVSIEACEDALSRFLAPDPYSSNPEHEGRRIIRTGHGWSLINYEYYRRLMSLDERRARDAARKRDVRICPQASAGVRRRPQASAKFRNVSQAEAEAEADQDPPVTPPSGFASPEAPLQQSGNVDSWHGEGARIDDATGVAPVTGVKVKTHQRVNPVPGTDMPQSGAPLQSKRKTSKRPCVSLPDALAPNDTARYLAQQLGVDLSREFPAFLDHHRARASKFADWQAAIRTWIRNAQRFAPKSASRRSDADDRMQRQADRVRMLREQEAEDERRKAAGGGT